jgi:hypothetical protein
MAYKLKDDEIALILRPISFDRDGNWSGLISTSLAVGVESGLDQSILADLVRCATFLSTFLNIAHEFPDIMEIVEERRDEMLNMLHEDLEEEKNGLPGIKVHAKDGNVIMFGPTTKTKGRA